MGTSGNAFVSKLVTLVTVANILSIFNSESGMCGLLSL